MRVRTFLSTLSIPALLLVLALDGCSDDNNETFGTAGARCYAHSRCNSGLTCVGTVCVDVGGGGTAPTDASADARDGAAGATAAAGHDGAAGAGGAAGASADGAAADAPSDSASDATPMPDAGADATDAGDV